MNMTLLLWILGINLILSIAFTFFIKGKKFFFFFYLIIIALLFWKFPNIKTLYYFVLPNIFIGGLIALLTYKKPQEKEDIFNMVASTNKGNLTFPNFNRGVAIFGASGSGKTQSVIYNFLKHFKKFEFAGVIYDYKKGELTEIALGLFDNVCVIAPNEPTLTERINFISPEFLRDETDIQEIALALISNFKGNDKQSKDFFSSTGQSLFFALILKFKLDYPEFCTFPHIVAFLTTADFQGYITINQDGEIKEKFSPYAKLVNFLSENPRVKMQAQSFISGVPSDNQTAGVVASIINDLAQMINPRIFWTFSKNEINIDITKEGSRKVVCVLNDPKEEKATTPFVGAIIQLIIKRMMIRGQKQSFVLLDEAPTLTLLNMARIPATMRSFNIATIYCAQDVTQGYVQYGGVNNFKEILANLSIQMIGKTNDPDSAKFYENYAELVEIESISESKDNTGFFGSTKGVNVSKREQRKYRTDTFMKLKAGEFISVRDGVSDLIKFNYEPIKREPLIQKNVSEKEVEYNFNKILTDIKFLCN